MSHLTFHQREHDVLPYAWEIAKSYWKNLVDETGNAIDNIPNGTDSSDGGSEADGYSSSGFSPAPKPASDHITADFFDLLDRLDKFFPHIGGARMADDAPDWGTHAAFDPVRSNDLAITVADRYLKTGLKEATNSPARGDSANIEAAGLAEPRLGLPADSSKFAVAAGIDHGDVKRADGRQQSILPRPGRHIASGHRDDPIFIYEISTRVAH